jgi:hypothetical protein
MHMIHLAVLGDAVGKLTLNPCRHDLGGSIVSGFRGRADGVECCVADFDCQFVT